MAQGPLDPLDRFFSMYDALNAERGWWSDASCLRFAAIAAIACPGSGAEVARAIRGVAEDLRVRSGWFGELRSSLRFVVSAWIVSSGDHPAAFLAEIDRVREVFRARSLRRGGAFEAIAVLLLRGHNRLAPIEEATVERFLAVYDEMKRHHWWLTGPEDFPFCALLAGTAGSPHEIGEGVEAIYQALLGEGFHAGDPLQTASSILHLAAIEPATAARRFRALAAAFSAAGVDIWRSDYDELAVLSFLDRPTPQVVERVLSHRRRIESLQPKPTRSITFNLAASVTVVELALVELGIKGVVDAKALWDMQSVINAQRSAAAAAG